MSAVTLENMQYTKVSPVGFDATVTAIEEATSEAGFRVQHIHDVQETLRQKGFTRTPMKIVELCNAGYADKALRGDVAVSLFMPCKIVVYEDDGRTVVSALRPAMISAFFPEAGLEDVATEVDTKVRAIVDRATSQR